jgi:hypothetical protein
MPPALRHGSELSFRLILDLNPTLGAIETDMGVRSPRPSLATLPRRLSRYLLFKAEWYYNLGMPQWLTPADGFVLDPLQRLFLGTHKIEFYRVWFRNQLAEYARSMLSSLLRAGRGYADPAWCRRLLHSGRLSGEDAAALGRLLTLEVVHARFLEPGLAAPTATSPWTLSAVS